MKKLLYFLFFVFTLSAFSQIKITESDINGRMQIGVTHTEYIDTTSSSVDIGSTGASSWNFENWTYDTIIEAENINPASSPKDNEFPSATVVEHSTIEIEGVSTELWNYVLLDNQEYSNLGHYSSSTSASISTETLMKIDEPEIITKLALNYGDSWNQTTTRDFEITSFGFTTNYTIDSDITRTVDAYGTLTFPDGSSQEVLRVKVESEMTSNASGNPTTTYDLHYTFFSKTGAFLAVTASDHTAPDNGTIDIEQVTWAYGQGTTDVEKNDELPTEFNLAQNYPNPFNPSTKIEYSIPKSSNVTLRVYDVLGNEVQTLVDNELSPGVYNVEFSGADLSSGIYFYTLTAGNFVQTKKLMLVK